MNEFFTEIYKNVYISRNGSIKVFKGNYFVVYKNRKKLQFNVDGNTLEIVTEIILNEIFKK